MCCYVSDVYVAIQIRWQHARSPKQYFTIPAYMFTENQFFARGVKSLRIFHIPHIAVPTV
jgi:hypothetical protein